MKDLLSFRCVFQRTWIPRVWTVIAIVRRKCYRVDVWVRCVALSFFPVLFEVRGELSALSHSMLCGFFKGARKMFVLLGMVNSSGWFEECFISQRFQC